MNWTVKPPKNSYLSIKSKTLLRCWTEEIAVSVPTNVLKIHNTELIEEGVRKEVFKEVY